MSNGSLISPEEENVGVLGLFLLGRGVPQLKVPGKNIVISNSADILRYLYGDNCTMDEREAFLRPTTRSLELEKKFDRLGEDYRRFAYFHIFSSPVKGESVGPDNRQFLVFCLAI